MYVATLNDLAVLLQYFDLLCHGKLEWQTVISSPD